MRRLLVAAISLALATLAAPGAHAGDTPWAHTDGPSAGPSHAIGGTSAGCLAGAVRVLLTGRGLRVMRPERHRHYTHRVMLDVLRALGAAMRAEKLGPVALGDLSQPRGGPAPDGHSSHQTGLDVDIWYGVRTRRGKPVEQMMVDARHGRPARAWGARQVRLLQLAVADARVDRVFVHPLLKQALCSAPAGERAWLHKVRPWFGHDDHFHLRLACPGGDDACVPQGAIAPGDGCDELDHWLSPEAAAARKVKQKDYQSRVGAVPVLPAACTDLLED